MEYVLLKGHIKTQTEKSVLFTVCEDFCFMLMGQDHWFPKAYTTLTKYDEIDWLVVPWWLYGKKIGMATRDCNRFIIFQLDKYYKDYIENL